MSVIPGAKEPHCQVHCLGEESGNGGQSRWLTGTERDGNLPRHREEGVERNSSFSRQPLLWMEDRESVVTGLDVGVRCRRQARLAGI
jgi:hypothetical protein